MDYASIIPKEPPADIFEQLGKQYHEFGKGSMTYKCVGREEAAAWTDCENFGGDFRVNEIDRPVLLWCSECGRTSLATYHSPEKVCNPYMKTSSKVEIADNYYQTRYAFNSGDDILCPCCGANNKIYSATHLGSSGITKAGVIVVPTVAEGCLVLTKWNLEKHVKTGREEKFISPVHAYVVHGKKVVKLTHFRRYYYRLVNLGEWKVLKQLRDDLGCTYMYPDEPCLDGTSLENAKLWEYKAQTYHKDKFLPIPYIRLYLKKPQVENLVTAGMGLLLGDTIENEAGVRGSYYSPPVYHSPRLEWINWKDKRPAQMLGLTKEQLREARKAGWGYKQLACWGKCKAKVAFGDMLEMLNAVEVYEAESILKSVYTKDCPIKTIRYLQKQGESWNMYCDYLDAALLEGLDLEQSVVRWPQNLRAAHDRAMQDKEYHTTQEKQKKFAAMSKRCEGLAWERDGICIRPAATPQELVQEGKVLHHCVGRYADKHINGNIVLFIRHTRRPERSWYTLNLNVVTKKIVQNHGYRNDRTKKGEPIPKPKELIAFLDAWQQEVLAGWKLPTEPKEADKKKATAKKQRQPAPAA